MRVANIRGKKPILNDIKNIILKLDFLTVELNDCKPKTILKNARHEMFSIIANEGYRIGKTDRLIKRPQK